MKANADNELLNTTIAGDDIFIEEDFPQTLDQVKVGSVWRHMHNHKQYVVNGIDSASDCPISIRRADDDSYWGYETLDGLRLNYLSSGATESNNSIEKLTAPNILEQAVSTMADRGKEYDTSGQGTERSMDKIVTMFNALTGHELTTAQGWKFMCCLKLARSEQGRHKDDNYLDGAAYFALAGEAASEANSA